MGEISSGDSECDPLPVNCGIKLKRTGHGNIRSNYNLDD